MRAQSDISRSFGRKALVIVEGREAKKGDSWWLMRRSDILSFPTDGLPFLEKEWKSHIENTNAFLPQNQ